MANYYSNKNKYLWKRGVTPILLWFSIGTGGYFLFLFFHGLITNTKNTGIIILWGVVTLFLFIFWIKITNKKADAISSFIEGYICEQIIKPVLKSLPNDYSVIYNVYFGKGGNIDFVVVCKYGVFAVEVKKWFTKSEYITQSKRQASSLQKHLVEHGVKINFVEPILIYTFRKVIHKNYSEGVEILTKKQIVTFFEKNMPVRNYIKFNNEEIKKIVKVLI